MKIRYVRIYRGVCTFYGMALHDAKIVLLYEEACRQCRPMVLENATVEGLLLVQIEHANGEEITEEEWIDFMARHTALLIANRPTEEDIP